MHVLAVFFRIVLYLVIAVLLAVNFHFYMIKRGEDARSKENLPPVQTASQDTSPSQNTEQLPPVEPPKPQADQILAPGPDRSVLAKKALESFQNKDYKNAADSCRQLAEKNPKDHRCLGLALFMLGDYPNAIISFEKALQAGADEYICRRFLAFAYYYRHDLDNGLKNAEKALALDKDPELEAFYQRLLREKNAQRNYASESTNHFKIEFDGYEHGGISRTVISVLEDAYSRVGKELNYYPPNQITVVLYTNRDFHDITQTPSAVLGQFDLRDVKIRIPVRGADKQEALLRTVLVHEYIHALIHSIARNVPLWIHEGMAEYFSKGPAEKVWQEYVDARGKRIPTHDPSRHPYWGYHCAISLLIDKYSIYKLREFLEALGSGKEYKQAFKDTYKISIEDFIDSARR